MRLVDPTLNNQMALIPPAPRPRDLDGAVIGLLANGKTHGMDLLDLLVDDLARRHRIAGVVRLTKANASAPLGADDATMFSEQCMAVISAIGD